MLVFSAGIVENSAAIRNRICTGMDYLDIKTDEHKNESVKLSHENNVVNISDENACVNILAIKTDEQISIALDAQKIVEEKDKVNCIPKIPIAISARHVHLCRATLEILFGKDYE